MHTLLLSILRGPGLTSNCKKLHDATSRYTCFKFKPAGRIQVNTVLTGMEGGITLRALTGDLDIAQTGGQRKATHGTTSDLVKARHFRRPRALARPLGLRPPFFPLLAGIVLVAVLSILLAHISSEFIVFTHPASPREWLEQEWMNGPSLLQLSTSIFQTRDVDGLASRIHSTNDAFFVNEKGGSPCNSSFLVQHAVQSAYVLFPIAQ